METKKVLKKVLNFIDKIGVVAIPLALILIGAFISITIRDYQWKSHMKSVHESHVTAYESAIKSIVDDSCYSCFWDKLDDYEGVGILQGNNQKEQVVIHALFENSPAYHAGIKAGDILLGIDDFDLEPSTSYHIYDIVDIIRGPVGTVVNLTVMRDGKILTIPVTRGKTCGGAIKYATYGNERDGNILTFPSERAIKYLGYGKDGSTG